MLLLLARERVMGEFRPILHAFDISEQQWRVLRALSAAQHPITVGELAERTLLLGPSLSRILAHFAERGLITRASDAGDQRRSRVAIAPAGAELVSDIAPLSEERYRHVETEFGTERLEALYTLLASFAESGVRGEAASTGHDGRVNLESLDALIRDRRTNMFNDPDREVPTDLINRLCALAMWAPNHKRTWPARFALFTGAGRHRLGEAFHADMVANDVGDDVKRAKTLTKYLRSPSMLVVGCSPPPKAGLYDDDRDAVAAGVQNLLLAATAAGLNSYWSTAPVTVAETVNALAGFEPGTRTVGVIYLGYPSGKTVETPERPAVALTHIGE